MLGDEKGSGTLRQVWLVVAMVLILAALGIGVLLDLAPRSSRATVKRLTATPTTRGPASMASAPTIALTLTASRSSAAGQIVSAAAAQPSSTTRPTSTRPPASPTPLPSVTLTAPPPTATRTPAAPTAPPVRRALSDHLWLDLPIAPEGVDVPDRTYAYGSRGDGTYPIHHGVEFVNPFGTPVQAVAAGRIVVAGDDSRHVYGAQSDYYGNLVIEELDQRLEGKPVYVLYGHLSEVATDVGRAVASGDTIGRVGMSGIAEGPHLHFEIRYGDNDYGATVNPELWLKPKSGRGVLAGVVLSPDGRPVTEEVQIVIASAATPDKAEYWPTTYPSKEVNADPAWGEGFAIGDVPIGQWQVQVYRSQRLYTVQATVVSGQTAWVEIQTAK